MKLNSTEKYKLMKQFSTDFSKTQNVSIEFDDTQKIISLDNKQLIINCSENSIDENSDSTIFDVFKRTYTKKHKKLEVAFMRFVLDYKIGFVPK